MKFQPNLVQRNAFFEWRHSLRICFNLIWGLCIILGFNFDAFSQDPTHRIFSTDNGLPSNEVYKIIEDQNGYIWMATDRGVVKYNGYEFTIFTTEDGLTDNVVFWIHEDTDGRIWFICQNRTICFYKNGVFMEHPASPNLKEEQLEVIYSIYVQSNGVVWLGCKGKTPILKLYMDGRIKAFGSSPARGVVVRLNKTDLVYGIRTDKLDQLDMRSVVVYDSTAHVIHDVVLKAIIGDNIMAISTENQIYISNRHHIHLLGDTLEYYELPNEGTFTMSLFEDQHHNIWVGKHGGGLFRFFHGNLEKPPMNIFWQKNITSICQDREGGFWISSIGGGVFYCPSIEALMIRSIEVNKAINRIVVSDSSIWVNTTEGVLYEIKKEEDAFSVHLRLADGRINRNIYRDNQERVWISSTENLDSENTGNEHLISFRGETVQENDSLFWFVSSNNIAKVKLPECEVLMQEDINADLEGIGKVQLLGKDSLLIGAYSGLWVYSSNGISRLPFHHPILENRINHIQKLEGGDIIISTMGQGVIRLNSEGVFQQVKKRDGMITNLINCSYTLPGDSVTWVGSSMGLSKIEWPKDRAKQPEVSNFTVYNGLSSNEIKAMDFGLGKLWLGTGKGITFIDPEEFSLSDKEPLLHEKGIFVNGAKQGMNSPLYLTKSDLFKVKFEGIAMSSNRNINYYYRFKGLGDTWEKTTNRFIEFRGFAPGDYELEIYASNTNGVRSEKTIRIPFIVKPPYWQTWWFQVLIIFILIAVIGTIFGIRFRIKQREVNLLTNSLEAEQEALSSQITPHFLFNALNSIQNLVQNQKSDEAVLQLANFAWLMRRILYNVKLHSIPLSNEIETLNLYLDLEVMRLQGAFSYQIDCEAEVDTNSVKIPPMLIQPFIENAIWHGIMNNPGHNGKLGISIKSVEPFLMVIITDNGVGRKEAGRIREKRAAYKKSTGIKSVSRRMEVLNQIYKSKLSFIIVDLGEQETNETGTRVEIKIPLSYE